MNLEIILSKIRSIKLCLTAHPHYEAGSEFEDRVSDLEDIENELQKWSIESVDRYYYASGRNAWTYVETTFFFNPITKERKEEIRQESIFSGQEYSLSIWARSITQRRKNLESDRVY